MLDVSFYNKNLYRKYPYKSSATMISDQGVEMPLTLIGGLRISTIYGYHNLYISKIVINGNIVNVTVSNLSPNETIGYFTASLTQDFQTVSLTANKTFAAGYMVFGFLDSIGGIQGSHSFDINSGGLEESIATCVVTPPIQHILVNGKKISGEVVFSYDNIKESLGIHEIDLSIIDMNSVMSRNDFSSERNSCPTNSIGSINGVKPLSGNIDIYGILPVVIDVTSAGIQVTTPGIGLTDICTNVRNNIPPIPAGTDAEKNHYLEDFLTATQEEWKTWPQYNQ